MAAAPGDPWALLVDAQVDDDASAIAVATEKRKLVVERWREADDLPLVRDVRSLVGEPVPESDPPEPASVPILMTPADGSLDAEQNVGEPGADTAVDRGVEDGGAEQDGAAP